MIPSLLKKLTAVASFAMVASAAQAQAVTLNNADFTNPITVGWYNDGTDPILGTSLSGNTFANLDGDDVIYQSFSLLADGLYTISFDASGDGRSRLFLSSDVGANNFSSPVGLTDASFQTWGPPPTWQHVSYSFTGMAGQSYHLYISGHGDGLFVDNVAVAAAVPEPESYAMMLAGLGAMGFMARRRQRSQD